MMRTAARFFACKPCYDPGLGLISEGIANGRQNQGPRRRVHRRWVCSGDFAQCLVGRSVWDLVTASWVANLIGQVVAMHDLSDADGIGVIHSCMLYVLLTVK